MSKKRSSKSNTKGRVCGVCIAGLVSGMASGGVLARKRAKAQQGRSGGTLQPIGWWYSDERVVPPKWLPAKTREEAIQKGHEKNPGAGFYILPRMPDAEDFEEVERRHATGEEPFPEYIEARGRSGGRKPDLVYRVKFDRPKHLPAAGYDALVKLEAGPLTRKELDAAMLRWKVGAKTYDVHTGALLFRTDRGPNGELYVWDLSEKKGHSAGRTRKGRSSGQEVANGILEQLGGRKFLVMTSAKHLLSFHEPGHGGLQFKLPRSGARAKLGIDAVRITLEPSDTYTMDFYKGMTKVRSIGSLYSDDLRKTFTEVTGLETSLGTMGRAAGQSAARPPARALALAVLVPSPGSRRSSPGDPHHIEDFHALRWLGGQKFLTMVGATNLRKFPNGEEFDLPKDAARLGIDHVLISYGEARNSYSLYFWRNFYAKESGNDARDRPREVYSADPIRGEDLRREFTEVTGLPRGADGDLPRAGRGRAVGKTKEPVSWGVFPYTPDSSPNAGDPVPDTRRGYVAREVNRETGRGTHWPYSRVQAVRIYWRRHLADAYATALTYGRKKS